MYSAGMWFVYGWIAIATALGLTAYAYGAVRGFKNWRASRNAAPWQREAEAYEAWSRRPNL